MKYPLVSVIIPTRNEEENIKQCLESINKLDYPRDRVEIIVVDNGSTDNTVNIAKQYNVKVLEIPHLNISGLRNKGVKNSMADIVAFIDADILVTEKWLSCGIDRLQRNSKYGCVGGYIEIPTNNTWVEKTWHLDLESKPSEFETDWITAMNMFVKKNIFLEAGGFNENLVTAEDVDLCFRVKKISKILFTKKIKAIHIGEAKNLKHFFLKERWRGQSNLSGVLMHGIHLRELPSVLIPLYYLLFYIIIIPITLFANVHIILFLLGLFIAIPLSRSFLICIRLGRFSSIFPLTLLWSLYFNARAFALVSGTDKRK